MTESIVSELSIPKNAKNKDAAYAYLNAMLEPQPQQEFAKNMGYNPTANNAGLPADLAARIGFAKSIEDAFMVQDQEYLAQNDRHELDAAVIKDGLVRATALPLVFRALGTETLPRGARVRVRITGSDLLTLEVHATLLGRLDDAASPAGNPLDDEAEADEATESASPLALAIDVDDAGPAAADSATEAAASR